MSVSSRSAKNVAGASALVTSLLLPLSVAAQQAPEKSPAADVSETASTDGDIIVTARKRNESAVDVPVAISAIGRQELENFATRDLGAIAVRVPSLVVSPAGIAGSIAIRGVTSSPNNPSQDQAVSLNVDGVQVGSVQMLRLAQIDLQQVEVLKGPQALFFGKNSPGGVISLRSADPTGELHISGTADYEFNARQTTGTLVVSTPLTDTLGVRGALYGSNMTGYIKAASVNAPGISYPARHDRVPSEKELFFRGTMLFQPDSGLTVRAKYSFGHKTGSDPYALADRYGCPYGAPQLLGLPIAGDNCRLDGTVYGYQEFNPTLLSNARYGELFTKQGLESTQHLASVELSYDLADRINFTSVSGFYNLHDSFRSNATFAPTTLLVSGVDSKRREISQEVRLATSKTDWPVNFMVGGYFQDTDFSNDNPRVADAYVATRQLPLGTPFLDSNAQFFVNTTAYSLFGQATWNILPTVELAGGARWSKETKRVRAIFNDVPVTNIPIDRLSSTDVSPEVTLSWKPMTGVNIFGAYRNGFKSGGFNTAGFVSGADLTYRPESASGFELGAKYSRHGLRFNVTGYSYLYKGLQVSGTEPATLISKIFNAGSARIRGVEADVSFEPAAVEGLTLRAAVNYNQARYKDFLVNCFTGQTIAEGCAFTRNPSTGAFFQQDMGGRPLSLAPDWTGNIGFDYETPVATSLKLGLSTDLNYSSAYSPILTQSPDAIQPKHAFVNAAVRIGDVDGRWKFALIGQNLTNVYRTKFGVESPFTGIGSRTGTTTTGGRADIVGFLNRGRQIRLQGTFSF